MIQDIHPHQFSNVYIEKETIENEDYIFFFLEKSILLRKREDDFELLQKKDFPEISDDVEKTFLFTLNNKACFLIWDKPEWNSTDISFHDIVFFRNTKRKDVAWGAIVAFQLWNWYTDNQFCGKCGTKTIRRTDERAILCPRCKKSIYPKISPAIIVAIISGEKILLARSINFPDGWYSLVAGYVDVGETLEETVIREVKEEVGVDVWNIRYYKNQPWPTSGSQMIGFIAEADDNQPIVIDTKEIASARWFHKKDLPSYPPDLAIAGEMINKFKEGTLI